jgi:hypothetical protein
VPSRTRGGRRGRNRITIGTSWPSIADRKVKLLSSRHSTQAERHSRRIGRADRRYHYIELIETHVTGSKACVTGCRLRAADRDRKGARQER